MRTAIITVDSAAVSPSRALAAVARLHDRLVCVTHRAYAELVDELVRLALERHDRRSTFATTR